MKKIEEIEIGEDFCSEDLTNLTTIKIVGDRICLIPNEDNSFAILASDSGNSWYRAIDRHVFKSAEGFNNMLEDYGYL